MARYVALDPDWRLCVFCHWRQLEPTGKKQPGPGTWRCTSCERTYSDRVVGSETERDRKRRQRQRLKGAAA